MLYLYSHFLMKSRNSCQAIEYIQSKRYLLLFLSKMIVADIYSDIKLVIYYGEVRHFFVDYFSLDFCLYGRLCSIYRLWNICLFGYCRCCCYSHHVYYCDPLYGYDDDGDVCGLSYCCYSSFSCPSSPSFSVPLISMGSPQ